MGRFVGQSLRIWLGESPRPELCKQLADTWRKCLRPGWRAGESNFKRFNNISITVYWHIEGRFAGRPSFRFHAIDIYI